MSDQPSRQTDVKVSAGDPFNFPARTFNTMLDASDYYRQQIGKLSGKSNSVSDLDQGIITIQNRSGVDVPKFGILEIEGPLVHPTVTVPPVTDADNVDNADAKSRFDSRIIYTGVAPTGDANSKFVILLDALSAGPVGHETEGQLGRAVDAGSVQTDVLINSEDDLWADSISADTVKLGSGTGGCAFIRWKQPLAERLDPTIANCVVRLGNPGSGSGSVFFLMGGTFDAVRTRLAQAHAIAHPLSGWRAYNGPPYLDVGGFPSYPETLQLYKVRDSATFNGKLYAVGTFQINPHLTGFGLPIIYDTVNFAERDFVNNCWKEAGNHSADGHTKPDGDGGMCLQVFPNAVIGSVAAATNASPIAITCSSAHGLVTGRTVVIADVVGNLAANAEWVVTVTGTNTFTLNGSTGSGVYVSGGTVYGESLYIGGAPRVGGASCVEKWNGTSSGGFSAVSVTMLDFCYAMVVWEDDPSGDPLLYAGGYPDIVVFDSAGSSPALLDGGGGLLSTGGIPAVIQSLCVHDDGTGEKLYVGSNIRTVDGNNANGLCRWTGSAYERFNFHGSTSGLGSLTGGQIVWCMASFNGKLAIGTDVPSGNPVAIWDGSTISSVPANQILGSVVRSMAVRTVNGKEELIFVGTFDRRQAMRIGVGADVQYEARYNATDDQFYKLAQSLDGPVYDHVTLANGDVLATGEFTGHLVYGHSGTWTVIGNAPSPGRSICLATVNGQAGTAIIGGDFGLRLWNGTGDAQTVGSVTAGGMDSKVWQVMTDPGDATKIFVVGDFDSVCGTGGNYCAAVLSNTASVWVVTTISSTPLSADDGYPVIRCCAHDGTNFYAGGNFKGIGGVSTNINFISKWNGSAWSVLNTGLAADVFKLCWFSGTSKLYAAQNTASPGFLRQWAGSTWANFSPSGGASPNRRPAMLKVDGAYMYVDYQNPSDSITRLGRLDSSNVFTQVGCGYDTLKNVFSDAIRTVTTADTGGGSELTVGGSFGAAGASSGEIDDFTVILNIGILDSAMRYKPLMGGIGQMVLDIDGTGFGNPVVVQNVRVLDIPDIGNGCVVAGGFFGMASEVVSQYVSVIDTNGMAHSIGGGLGPVDNSGVLRGCHAIYRSADGRWWFGGHYTEAYNTGSGQVPVVALSNGTVQRVHGRWHSPIGGDVIGDSFCFVDQDVTAGYSSTCPITDASNASPIVITCGEFHGLDDGDSVTISGVVGNTNANGTFKVTTTSSTVFSLDGSAGNAAYVSGGSFPVARNGRPIVMSGHSLDPWLSLWDPVKRTWVNSSTTSIPLATVDIEPFVLLSFQGHTFCAVDGSIVISGSPTHCTVIRYNSGTVKWEDVSPAGISRSKAMTVGNVGGMDMLIACGPGTPGAYYRTSATSGSWSVLGPASGSFSLNVGDVGGVAVLNGVPFVGGALEIGGVDCRIAYQDTASGHWIAIADGPGTLVGEVLIAVVGGKVVFGGDVADLIDYSDSRLRRVLNVGVYTMADLEQKLFTNSSGKWGANNPPFVVVANPPLDTTPVDGF